MQVCAILGALDGLFASNTAQPSANAKPGMCLGAAFLLDARKCWDLGTINRSMDCIFPGKKHVVDNVFFRGQPCLLGLALLSQPLACCWAQLCARAQPGPGVHMGLRWTQQASGTQRSVGWGYLYSPAALLFIRRSGGTWPGWKPGCICQGGFFCVFCCRTAATLVPEVKWCEKQWDCACAKPSQSFHNLHK